ncbi:hypothetical protein [Bradyrhizobium sp. CCBAU 53421]|uniref:hypothetical protein n=1 Tax=Bradyrhizobium sp. CCBAU 53421 TaxID=1325120 RepID=UPI00188A2DEA|nr:hypothetical protein [Bradyrhizobium sp. CCBAU 53421]
MGKLEQRDDVYTDECLLLLATFIKVKDRKSRAEIIRFAERFAFFDHGIVAFDVNSHGR